MIPLVKENICKCYKKTQEFVLEKPLIAFIYSVAMKALSLIYFFYFPPVSYVICSTLFGSSLIFDLSAVTNFQKYKDALSKKFDEKCNSAQKVFKDFIYEKAMKLLFGRK
jgi:hypothetical protein